MHQGAITLTSRPFSGESDLDLLIEFARRATAARWPRSTYWHAGDIVWQVPAARSPGRPVEDIRLWFDAAGLAGFVLFEPPLRFDFDLRPDLAADGPVLVEMLAWAEGRRRDLLSGPEQVPKAYAMLGERTVATTALESDVERIAALDHYGYVPGERGDVHYARSLDIAIPEGRLPEGMRVRHATGADLAARVDLHRDAWSVWGPSSATVDAYRRLRTVPLYDEELDVVVEAEGGTLVSYCIAWVDGSNGGATFEPVGTRPDYAGRGLAREVIFEACRRLVVRGMHTALVSTAGVNERALRLYPSCGFEVVDHRRFYVKPVAP